MKTVLYISYDGMTDPLGQSQVLPYLLGLAEQGYGFHLLSFEKWERLEQGRARIEGLLEGTGVVWHPRRFHARPRLVAKAWDWWTLRRSVAALHRTHHFDLVHCRSYQAARAGQILKRRRGVPYLFDMRGFWVDERMEGGIWDPANPFYRWLYRRLKAVERTLVAEADQVVSLTRAAKEVMRGWPGMPLDLPIDVIPCCVDVPLFTDGARAADGAAVRRKLGVPENAFLLLYLGSIGTWYLLEDMLRFFRALLKEEPEARFLFVTPQDPQEVARVAERIGVPRGRVLTRAASRDEVPRWLAAGDLSVFFIRPSFSKIASCPTKLAESLAAGLPVLCNAGVGDVDEIVQESGVGRVLPDLERPTLRAAAKEARKLAALPRERLEGVARERFSLEGGVEAYARLYRHLIGEP